MSLVETFPFRMAGFEDRHLIGDALFFFLTGRADNAVEHIGLVPVPGDALAAERFQRIRGLLYHLPAAGVAGAATWTGGKMPIQKIDHIGIRVADFDRSQRFYAKLGFSVIRVDAPAHVVVMRHPGGVELNLLDTANHDHGRENVLMDLPRKYPGYTHFALQVDSVADAAALFQAIGVTVTEGPVTFGDGKTSVFIRDPDLNVIEFTEHPKS